MYEEERRGGCKGRGQDGVTGKGHCRLLRVSCLVVEVIFRVRIRARLILAYIGVSILSDSRQYENFFYFTEHNAEKDIWNNF